jgi:hypothetical protein
MYFCTMTSSLFFFSMTTPIFFAVFYRWSNYLNDGVKRLVPFFFHFFFKLPFPFFAIRLFTVPFGRPFFFHSNFLVPLPSQVMRRGSRALSPATHAHSTSHSQTYTTTFIYPWAPLPDGTRTRADLAVVAERVLILPSTTLPSAPRRHTHPGGGSFF